MKRLDLHHLLSDLAMGRCQRSSSRKVSARLRLALLEFGSATPDNRSCTGRLEYGQIRPAGAWASKGRGIKIKSRPIPLSRLTHAIEDMTLPDAVKKRCPKLTERQWDAAMRAVTLILLALES